MSPYDPDYKEKLECQRAFAKDKDRQRLEKLEAIEERLAIQEESGIRQTEIAKEIPKEAREFLNKIKGVSGDQKSKEEK